MKQATYIPEFNTDCQEWLGYKPCDPQKRGETEGCEDCQMYRPWLGNALIIEAGGLGSVARTTTVSRALKEQHPDWRIQWATHDRGAELLQNVPSVDSVLVLSDEAATILSAQRFDSVINYESATFACALAKTLDSADHRGFTLHDSGQPAPVGATAQELQRLQVDDRFRRRLNEKPTQRILLEAAGIPWQEQRYDINVNPVDRLWAQAELAQQLGTTRLPKLIGLNIGTATRTAAKRWQPEAFVEVASELVADPDVAIVILAGPEEEAAYQKIEALLETTPLPRIVKPGHANSIGQFLALVEQQDVVVSADTFGLHAAIGLERSVVSLHGPQPEQEIFLYGRGEKLHLNLECAPCFATKPELCHNIQRLSCMRDITPRMVVGAVRRQLHPTALPMVA